MKRQRLGNDKLLRNGICAGAVLGVLTALAFGIGSAFGAEAEKTEKAGEGWVVDTAVGAYRYYGADGEMWTNAVTPDGYYVDRNGVMIPAQYTIEQFTTIPKDAKSLLVIEGHGIAGRATFYTRETSEAEAAQVNTSASRTSAPSAAAGTKEVSLEGPGQAKSSSGSTAAQEKNNSDKPKGSGEVRTTEKTAGMQEQKAEASAWKQVFNTNATLGREGIGKEVEGDGKTPRGIYTLDQAFGTEPDPGNFNVPYLQVHSGHYWVGDSESPYYNQMVDINETGDVFNKKDSEHLSTIAGIGYHYCMSVGYNKECTPYKGSAIFLHCIEGPMTAGCIAIPKEDMEVLLQKIQLPAYILIDDGENLKNY